jgi:pyruvate dehydrogenase E2 component (dihydrolipoamide acetyltransferase)
VLMKAAAEALKRVPALNTVLSGGNILYFDEANIGFAVALDEGLIVPVVRDVGRKNIREVSAEANELAGKAREGRLLPDDLLGGTFTVSVLGVVDAFTPILNRGQSAILGVGRSVEKPIVKDGDVVVREMMTVSLTADHQVVDGAVAAGFLRRFQQMVERPAQLFR